MGKKYIIGEQFFWQEGTNSVLVLGVQEVISHPKRFIENFQNKGGDGQSPSGLFREIHPFWQIQASLKGCFAGTPEPFILRGWLINFAVVESFFLVWFMFDC